MLRRTVLPGLILFLALTVPGISAPPAPPPPPEYDALVRFHIEGFRTERVLAFREMKSKLEDLGFKEDPDDPVDPTDPKATNMLGTVPSAKAREMLYQVHVQTLRLQPKGYMPPAEKDRPVRVHIELNAGALGNRARLLRDEVRRVLAPLGFVEAAGFDDRGFTRLVGVVPARQVDVLASDLRRHPAGWALLSPTLLADLRNSATGQALVRKILDDWYDHPEGKNLLRRILSLWRVTPAGEELLATLPRNVVGSGNTVDRVTVEVRLLIQMAGHPDAADMLQTLFADVLASKANRELMDILLKRAGPQLLTLNLPLFYRIVPAIRVVEVLPQAPLPSLRPTPPAIPPGQEKLSPDLRELLTDMAEADKRRRLEVVLGYTPTERDREWKAMLRDSIPGLVVEGSTGPLATVLTEPKMAVRLTALPDVAAVRLPRVARPQMQDDPNKARSNFEPLRKSGVEQLHLMGRQGKGTRVAVIDGDFRGWQQLRGKQLPAGTRMIDLTAERSPNLLPDPETGPAQEQGHGTRYALALMRAAPSVELTLIRIDPGAPYQLLSVAQTIAGDTPRSLDMENRLAELEAERRSLNLRKDLLLDERRKVFEDFGVDEEATKRRQDYFHRQAELDKEQQSFTERVERYFALQRQVRSLKDVRIVASGLVWTDGYPVDGTSTLSRYFDDRPFRSALWFQAAGDTQGQSWSGLFRDEDGNGVMEFLPSAGRLPPEAWSRELNFLAWRSAGQVSRDLPQGAQVRITLQWKEAHDPTFFQIGDDPYRRPLASFRIVLLHQADPKGEKQPADDLEVVAETVGYPQRLDRTARTGTYEQVLQFKVPRAGRYLVRIEGKAPESTRPAEAPTLPAARKVGEVRPRLFVETLQGQGRAIWHTFATDTGTLGMPADAMRVVTVGAADENDRRQPDSAGGPPLDQELASKPDVLAYDAMDQKCGTGLAASFAAGVAATTTRPDTTPTGLLKRLRIQPGEVLRVYDGPR